MKKYFSMYAILLSAVANVVALDQWTKWLVRENIPFATRWLPESMQWLMPYARIVHWRNSGAAFGMFQDGATVFTVLAFVVIGAILFYYPQVASEGWMFRLAMGLQLSGAFGNLIDRLAQDGKVTDFISIGTFPVFNIADSAISVGTVILILAVWLSERAEKQARAESDAQTAGSGLVDINSALIGELNKLPGIGPSTAQLIIDYREENGLFAGNIDIMHVSGIGPVIYKEIKNLIVAGAQIAGGELVDINSASIAVLEKLPRIRQTTAQNIINYREENGPFARTENIVNVSGIGSATYKEIKNMIVAEI